MEALFALVAVVSLCPFQWFSDPTNCVVTVVAGVSRLPLAGLWTFQFSLVHSPLARKGDQRVFLGSNWGRVWWLVVSSSSQAFQLPEAAQLKAGFNGLTFASICLRILFCRCVD